MFKNGETACPTGIDLFNNAIYYINTNEIPGELSRENLISSHVKILPLLWFHNKSLLLHQKAIKVKWFGSSLVSRVENSVFLRGTLNETLAA